MAYQSKGFGALGDGLSEKQNGNVRTFFTIGFVR